MLGGSRAFHEAKGSHILKGHMTKVELLLDIIPIGEFICCEAFNSASQIWSLRLCTNPF